MVIVYFVVTSTPNEDISIALQYNDTINDDCSIGNNIDTQIHNRLKIVNTNWNSQLCQKPDCTDIDITLSCSGRITSVSFVVPNLM